MMVYLVVFGHTEFFTGKKLFRDVQEYIDDHYAETHVRKNVEFRREQLWHLDEERALELEKSICDDATIAPDGGLFAAPSYAASAKPRTDWHELIKATDEGFSQALLRLIDEKGMTDVQCYKKANVDRRLFSKIRSDTEYRPSKPTVLAFAMALKLTQAETQQLLRKAGFVLTRSSKLDLVIEYCIKERFYDVFQINEVLYELDLPLLGNNARVV
jgi:hypothetical protein